MTARMRRAWRWLFGEPGRVFEPTPGVYWMTPPVRPAWRRPPEPKPLPPGWRSVGYTSDHGPFGKDQGPTR